jgi:alkanesulfonate monooxygenase SsuD/methylene tetrahydromethanopterin reductase-like flavin-dependent oxidoreductase (luciferase family)
VTTSPRRFRFRTARWRLPIPADIARELPLHGSPAAVAERLCSYAEAGAQHIVLGLISDDWRQQCDLLAEAVRLT